LFQRLNVSLTRAKALMIIVGDPNTLRNDHHWHNLLKFCQYHGGCVTPIDIGPRPALTKPVISINDMYADFRKLFGKIKEKLDVEDFK
jgi:helicase MOV-10